MAKKATIVNAVFCPICGDVIYSCHRHHYQTCTCGCVMVDGGRDYLRYGYHTPPKELKQKLENIEVIQIKINKSEEQIVKECLYQDLRKSEQCGIIKAEDQSELFKVLYLEGKKVKT